jgi:hypothetical protein
VLKLWAPYRKAKGGNYYFSGCDEYNQDDKGEINQSINGA